ncbi:cation:proton antiporter [Halomonas huangheensis]|uniref:Sodium:proton antiporter n=1 Tax=Halomonas huangheensis TaxID=1178482 RepID=W1N1U9_9GAMM|nr:sodium:proton antiporter [Halomonas huangheensis]ALM52242.1 sodium:proton antiporter [Halomonas huangheensis]ERL49464.1 sodium:proton antiporter [Halomonas huangheensis]
MSVYATLCLLAVMAMVISLINERFLKFQTTIAITAGALVLSLIIAIAGHVSWVTIDNQAADAINQLNFEDFLLKGMLGFLLFAGALGTKLPHLRDQKWEIAVLAMGSTLISTFFIGFALWGVVSLLGIDFDLIYCLLFGALISPTDPIAVLAIVKKMNAPRRISTQVEGESLFNDGFGLVVFVTIFAIAFGDTQPTFLSVSHLFLQEAVGGIVYGFVLGRVFHFLIKQTNQHSIELMLTMLVPTSGYVFAEVLHVSGPLAMVVAGLIIGNRTRSKGFSEESRQQLDHFWELVDEFLNGVLFLLIGMVMLAFSFHPEDWVLALAAIPLALAGRFVSVRTVYFGFNRFRTYNPWSVPILTWGGLRGGLSLAMAMSVPAGIMVVPDKGIDVREIILVMTYSVAVFSILVQGSSITPMIKRAKVWEQDNFRKPKR